MDDGVSASTVALGAALFASTNIDDIFLLSAFFADRRLATRSVIFGQFLGIGALTAGSAGAAMASLLIPDGWTALLGVVPLMLGIQKLWHLRAGVPDEIDGKGASDQKHVLKPRTRSQVFAVASVTVANGGDNLAVYVPAFASSLGAIPIYMLTFGVMTALWCIAGYALVNNALVGERIRRSGHIVLPVVLIAVGVWILCGAPVLFR